MESKFVALELADSKAKWLKKLLAYVPLGMKPTLSVSMYCDNQLVMTIAKNKTFNVKRIDI